MSEIEHWENRYREGDVPWDTGQPSSELVRVLGEEGIRPSRAIELGCGTGTNVVWLARQGFDVLGVDLSPLALERARAKAQAASVTARFLAADVLDPPELGGPYAFFFDRGCYHVVRRIDAERYVRTLEKVTAPGSVGLLLAGNAREPRKPGPPVVTEEELRRELSGSFEFVWLREFRFDPNVEEAQGETPLGWSCLLRRR